ncbi:MAG TPA: hypothetical protein VHB49_13960 [Bradyrhizobium sp.]|nr:hypothetical protein [Bradyrhizobium sp.]
MKPIWKFRLLGLVIVALVALFSITSLVAEFIRPAGLPLPSRDGTAPSAQALSAAELAATIAPFRTSLKADYAIALAGKALRSSEPGAQSVGNEAAQKAATSALKFGPHDSRMWLVLAQLRAQKNPADPLATEALKMSYLTGPNRAELIPIRLDMVTLNNALNDADLNELARSDVRAVLTQYSGQRPALARDYVRASAAGKKFLEDSTRMLDPAFADSLKDAK